MGLNALLGALLLGSLGLRFKQGRRFEWSPFLIWLSTSLAWTGGIVLGLDSEKTFMLDLLHVGAYLYFVFQFGAARWRNDPDHRIGRLFYRARPWLFYLPLIALSLLNWGLATTDGSAHPMDTLDGRQHWLPLLLLVPVMHYLMDGWIWKRRAPSGPTLSRMG